MINEVFSYFKLMVIIIIGNLLHHRFGSEGSQSEWELNALSLAAMASVIVAVMATIAVTAFMYRLLPPLCSCLYGN
jgi:hypothetical protein